MERFFELLIRRVRTDDHCNTPSVGSVTSLLRIVTQPKFRFYLFQLENHICPPMRPLIHFNPNPPLFQFDSRCVRSHYAHSTNSLKRYLSTKQWCRMGCFSWHIYIHFNMQFKSKLTIITNSSLPIENTQRCVHSTKCRGLI